MSPHHPGPGPWWGRGGTFSPSKTHSCPLPLRVKAHAPPKYSPALSEEASEPGPLSPWHWGPSLAWSPPMEPLFSSPLVSQPSTPHAAPPCLTPSQGLRGKSHQRGTPGAGGGAGGASLTAPKCKGQRASDSPFLLFLECPVSDRSATRPRQQPPNCAPCSPTLQPLLCKAKSLWGLLVAHAQDQHPHEILLRGSPSPPHTASSCPLPLPFLLLLLLLLQPEHWLAPGASSLASCKSSGCHVPIEAFPAHLPFLTEFSPKHRQTPETLYSVSILFIMSPY